MFINFEPGKPLAAVERASALPDNKNENLLYGGNVGEPINAKVEEEKIGGD